MKTFLFIGDSITDTNRVDENEENFGLGCGYALLFAAEFSRKYVEKFKFINRGVSGDRITDVYTRIKEDIINLKPDVMSILVGVNDVSHEITQNCGVLPEKFERIYSMLIEEIKSALPEIKIIIMEPFVLKGLHTTERWNEFSNEVKKQAEASGRIAEKYNLKFVPLQNVFDSLITNDNHRYWSVDGIHPTAAGHQVIKEELAKAFSEIL